MTCGCGGVCVSLAASVDVACDAAAEQGIVQAVTQEALSRRQLRRTAKDTSGLAQMVVGALADEVGAASVHGTGTHPPRRSTPPRDGDRGASARPAMDA